MASRAARTAIPTKQMLERDVVPDVLVWGRPLIATILVDLLGSLCAPVW
jgi:hypothetical protein